MKFINVLVTVLVLLGFSAQSYATDRIDQDMLEFDVEFGSTVVLDADDFRLPSSGYRYYWRQVSGTHKVRLHEADTAMAYYVAPRLADATDYTRTKRTVKLTFELMVVDTAGRYHLFGVVNKVKAPIEKSPPPIVTLRNDNEIEIPASYHPLGEPLVAVLHLPEGASADNPVAGCAIVHGSGGLFHEQAVGQSCADTVSSAYQNLSDQLIGQNVATIMPSSFYSRDHRFCEDTIDDEAEQQYLDFAGAPFFNGNDTVARDDYYKIRRVTIRSLDMLATMSFFCDLAEVDCSQSCMVGTSNGGTSILSYTAQSLPDDLIDFVDDDKRPFEYNSAHQKRLDAFANFPNFTMSNISLRYKLKHRNKPSFAQLISPGCTMRDLVPDIEPGNEQLPWTIEQLYYPAADTHLEFEVGSTDDVPKDCYEDSVYGEGLREIQARYFEQQMAIAEADSRYVVNEHVDGGHSLLQDDEFSAVILQRLDDLIDEHF